MNKIRTIIKKEWAEVFKNRMVLFTVIFLPLFMTALPLVILYFTGIDEIGDIDSGLTEQMSAYCPPGLTSGECFQVTMVSQFLLMYLIMPIAIPVTIAAYSIVGEKTTRSLEPLLATPISTIELLLGKSLAAAIPAITATYAAFLIFAACAYLIVPSKELVLALIDARWILAIFLVGPLMAILSITVSMIVSSRVNDPRAAEQISMVVIVPVLILFFGQISGLFLINRQLILLVAVILIALDAALVYAAVRLFQRETILTRWK